ncbi:MAG: hypothetical protein WB680_09175 [Candidatus Acidiferrales bacterium]
MKIAPWSLGILLILPVGFAAGQSQTPPPPSQQDAQSSSASTTLAEAAKRAREARKDQPKPAHVWDNDSVPKANDQISVVGETPANPAPDADNSAAAPAADNSANGAAATAPTDGHAGGALKSEIADAKDKLATIKTDLDLLERTNTLDSQMYYGKPDYSSDTEGAAKLKAEQDQIASKQQEMDDQQKKIDDLEAELAKQPDAGSADTSNSNSN